MRKFNGKIKVGIICLMICLLTGTVALANDKQVVVTENLISNNLVTASKDPVLKDGQGGQGGGTGGSSALAVVVGYFMGKAGDDKKETPKYEEVLGR